MSVALTYQDLGPCGARQVSQSVQPGEPGEPGKAGKPGKPGREARNSWRGGSNVVDLRHRRRPSPAAKGRPTDHDLLAVASLTPRSDVGER